MNVLEHPSHYTGCKPHVVSCYVYDHIMNIMNNVTKDTDVFVSLSGGVDSMVIASVLSMERKVSAIHINYNNREESDEEEHFLREWCGLCGIPIYVLHMGKYQRCNIERKEYERVTQKMRYEFYKEYSDDIILGHHNDDIVENVISNVMKKRSVLDLKGMHEMIHGVNVHRPLIGLHKQQIFDFADSNKIPYFKDTTPSWSVRCNMRNDIIPAIEQVYPTCRDALYKLGKDSDEWNRYINKQIFEKIPMKVQDEDIIVHKKHIINMPRVVFRTYINYLLTNKTMMPKLQAIDDLYKSLFCKKKCMILSKNVKALICDDELSIIIT